MHPVAVACCMLLLLAPLREGRAQLRDSITADAVLRHMHVLAHDSLEGRGTATRGERRAAAHIRDQLAAAGVSPALPGNEWLQWMPMHASRPEASATLDITFAETVVRLAVQRDVVLYESGAETFIPQPLPLVFVGYGIVAPEYDYNDYQDLDVRNAIVVMLSGEPPSQDSTYFAGAHTTVHALPAWKQRIALSRGARGSMIITLPRDARTSWEERCAAFAFEHVTPASTPPATLSAEIAWEFAPLLFHDSPHEFDEVLAMDSTSRMRSFALACGASYRAGARTRDARAANVVGVIEGADPMRHAEVLLLAAHYDALGVQAGGADSIWNGAVDNAIGTAVLIEIARALAADPPPRTVVVLFTTGEEKGLLGAQWYAARPARPLHRTIAAINIDGVSIFDRVRAFTGIGADLSTLGDQLSDVLHASGLRRADVASLFDAEDSFMRSDQFAFAQAGIPSMLVMESLDYESLAPAEGRARYLAWMRDVYHAPGDDMLQPFSPAAITQHASLLLALARHLADAAEPPRWHAGVPYQQARLRSQAEGR
jgi:hypothetical protein